MSNPNISKVVPLTPRGFGTDYIILPWYNITHVH